MISRLKKRIQTRRASLSNPSKTIKNALVD